MVLVKKLFLASLSIGMAAMLSGCATPSKMAFQNDSDVLTEQSKPVLLMTATVRNAYKPSFQPQLQVVHVGRPGAQEAKDRFNFTIDDKAKGETGSLPQGNHYLLRLQLDPGKYDIVGMTGTARSFPIIASFFVPIHSAVEVKENGVYYLGHVDATVRKRQGNEFRAGSLIPLIDQAIAGASGGTFDVEIVDAFDKDEAVFRTKFPALKNAEIQKAVLPPFDRAKAQRWWEAQ